MRCHYCDSKLTFRSDHRGMEDLDALMTQCGHIFHEFCFTNQQGKARDHHCPVCSNKLAYTPYPLNPSQTLVDGRPKTQLERLEYLVGFLTKAGIRVKVKTMLDGGESIAMGHEVRFEHDVDCVYATGMAEDVIRMLRGQVMLVVGMKKWERYEKKEELSVEQRATKKVEEQDAIIWELKEQIILLLHHDKTTPAFTFQLTFSLYSLLMIIVYLVLGGKGCLTLGLTWMMAG